MNEPLSLLDFSSFRSQHRGCAPLVSKKDVPFGSRRCVATGLVSTRVYYPSYLESESGKDYFPMSSRAVADAVYENVTAFLEKIRQEI